MNNGRFRNAMTGVTGLVLKVAVLVSVAFGATPSGHASTSALASPSIDGVWSELPAPSRVYHSLILDPVRDRLIMYGGSDGWSGTRGEVWTFPLATDGPWTEIHPSGPLPPTRQGASAIYDPINDRMLIFGGRHREAVISDLNDTWELSLGPQPAWRQLSPASSPPIRTRAGAIFDPLRSRMIVTGGESGNYRTDTWALDLTTDSSWVQIPAFIQSIYGTFPGPDAAGQSFYDPVKDQLVIEGIHPWALPLSGPPRWEDVTGSIGFNYLDGLVLDPVSQRAYTFQSDGARSIPVDAPGQYSWCCWTLNATTNRGPASDDGVASVYDAARQRILVVGGGHLFDRYWEVGALEGVWALSSADPSHWERLDSPQGSPVVGGSRAALALDTHRGQLVGLFTEAVGYGGAEIWSRSLDALGQWKRLADSAAVAAVPYSTTFWSLEGLIYDPIHDALVAPGPTSMQSVSCASGALAETPTSGTGPVGGSLNPVYDSARNRIMLVAYASPTSQTLGTWALSLAGAPEWSSIESLSGAPISLRSGVIYDAVGDRLIGDVVRDSAGVWILEDIWYLSLANPVSWQRLQPMNAGPRGPWLTKFLDPRRNRLLVVSNQGVGQIWALSLAYPPTWTQLHPDGVPASDGMFVRAFYDASLDRAIFYAQNLPGRSQSFWALTWGDVPTPTIVSLVEGVAREGRVSLRWHVDSPLMATIARNDGDGQWGQIASLYPDGLGQVSFIDEHVLAGHRYGYRLATASGLSTYVSPEVWVDMPQTAVFALDGFAPNPASGRLAVAFTLQGSGPATVDLFDVNGRRVITREVGSPGPGRHVVSLGQSGRVPAAVYWLRLSQGGRSLTRRGVVLN